MKTTFFDYIGAADMERIHSATIAWMISDSCKAFTRDERASLLMALFNVEKADIKSIHACNEYEHIDIAFITENSKKDKEIWVIENKIKAPLGHNQLSKYEKVTGTTINNVKSRTAADEYFKVKQKYPQRHFAVLSLIGILPQDDMGEWHCVTYSDMLKYIQNKRLFDKPISDLQDDIERRHYSIIAEYSQCVSNLVCALEQFRTLDRNFDFVFIEGNKKKSAKFENNKNDNIGVDEYISQNGLETLFQKDYFVSIIKEIKFRGINFDCHVSETHGNADFAFHFGNMGCHDSYVFDLSFQYGTFKFAVTEVGYPPLKDKDEEKWPPELRKWKKAFSDLSSSDSHYNRLNLPKSRRRVSVSYNFDKDFREHRKWYELNRQEFVEKVIEQIWKAQEMAQQVIEYYQKSED